MVLGDHPVDPLVRPGAGFDAVDFAVELVLVFGDIGEGAQPARVGVVRHRKSGLGVGKARLVQHAHLALLDEGPDVVVHQRAPVAEEHIQTVVAQAGEDDLLGGAGLLDLIAEALQQHLGHGAGGDHVGPADHAHAHIAAGVLLGGRCAAGEQEHDTGKRGNRALHGHSLRAHAERVAAPGHTTCRSQLAGDPRYHPNRGVADLHG
ncbi:hypothetical protein D3C78_1256830 [compost metagenome]